MGGICRAQDVIWKCTQCGKCCETISTVLPEFALKNGVCKHFDRKTRLCKIYFERPLQCRVDELYEKNMKHFMSKERYYINQALICGLVKES